MKTFIKPLIIAVISVLLASQAPKELTDLGYRASLKFAKRPLAHSSIRIVRLTHGTEWQSQLLQLLDDFRALPPKFVYIDFDLPRPVLTSVLKRRYPFPILKKARHPDAFADAFSMPSTLVDLPQSPYLKSLLAETLPTSVFEALDVDIPTSPVLMIPPDDDANIGNLGVEEILSEPLLAQAYEGKTVLISPPPYVRTPQILTHHAHDGYVAADERVTLAKAESINALIQGFLVKPTRPFVGWVLALGSSLLLAVWMLSLPPLMGILLLLLLLSVLILTNVSLLANGIFIDIMPTALSLTFTVYLLAPLRLLSEYRLKWKYQEENKFLSQVEEMQKNFMSLVSHNLNTPLTRLSHHLDAAQRSQSSESSKEALVHAHRSTDEIKRLIDQILYLTRIESENYQLNLQQKDFKSVLTECIDRFSAQVGAKDIQLNLDTPVLFPFYMDEFLISECLANLLENAIKYTPEKGQITMAVKETEGAIVFSVADSGPGIPQEDAARVFEKFYRTKNARTSTKRGSGLGLFLVKYFIDLHKGSVSLVYDNGDAKGARFRLVIPTHLQPS